MDAPPTIPQLFDTIELNIDHGGAVPHVAYDEAIGFPIEFAVREYGGDSLSGGCLSGGYASFSVNDVRFE